MNEDALYDEYNRVLLLQKQYIVGAADRFLRLKSVEFERHLEDVARRYVESVRLETGRVIEQAYREARVEYPAPGTRSTRTSTA